MTPSDQERAGMVENLPKKGEWFRHWDGALFKLEYVNDDGSFGAKGYDPLRGFVGYMQGFGGPFPYEIVAEPTPRYADPEWLREEMQSAALALDVNGYDHALALRVQLLNTAALLAWAGREG